MRIELLKYFNAVCETKSINAASQQLYISQQGLDKAIRQLEKELDTLLFLRSNAGVQLTEEGVLLNEYSKKILALYTQFEIDLSRKKINSATETKYLKIATNPLYSTILAHFFESFLNSTPQIQCRVSEMPNEEIPSALKNQYFDIGIMSYNNHLDNNESLILKLLSENNLTYQLLYEDELVMFMGSQNELTKKIQLTDEDTRYHKIILSDNTINAQKNYSQDISIFLNSTDYTLQQYYLTSQDCISCLPKLVGKNIFDEQKITYRKPHPPLFSRILFISPRQLPNYTAEEKLFFQALQLYLHELNCAETSPVP